MLDSYIILRERFANIDEMIDSLIELIVELAIMTCLDMNID